ncbi:MAG: immunoglobulin domain-containing protein [Verrucomicrobiales bacterium]|nr:immunoglobulin domain-containing protein [Verrucomicrobiales bacterium]
MLSISLMHRINHTHSRSTSAGIIALLLAASLSQHAHAQPGQIERGFTVPGMRTSRTLGVQPDGKVLLVGVFTNSPSGAFLVRLSADGSIEWKSAQLSVPAQTVAAGWNGEIFAGGDNTAYRFLPPATEVDATFAPGLGWRSSDPWAVAFQPNGGILIAGSGPTGSQLDWGTDRGLRNTPVRIAPSGSRDVDFFGRIGVGTSTDIAVLPDGSFLAARTDVRRFLADGTPDASFTPWNVANVELLRRLPSGDFLLGGGAMRSFNGTPVKSLIRVSASGVLDSTFNFAGVFDAAYDSAGCHRPVAVLADGRLVVGQSTGGIQRFLASGLVDPTWTDPAPTVVVRELVADGQGAVYVLGNLEGPLQSHPIYRLAGDETGPVPKAPLFTTQPAATTVATPGATVTLSAVVTGEPSPNFQWLHDGSPIRNATSASLTLANFQASDAGSYQLIASNRIAVVASSPATVHLDPGARRPGSPDVTFESPPLNPPAGSEGFVPTIVNPLFWGGAPTADGGLYLWGNFAFRRATNTIETGLVRLDAEGNARPDFHPGDLVRDAGGGALQSDERLVLGALFVSGTEIRDGVVRLLPDGSRDPSFAGLRLFEGTQQAGARIVTLQTNGGILVGGGFARVQNAVRPGLLRLHADGTLDTTFPALPLSSRVSAIVIAPDGDIYLGGSFSLSGATVEASVLRLNPDGTQDTAFTPFPGVIGVTDLELAPAGGVIVLRSGNAVLGGNTLSNPFRLDTSGVHDRFFDAGIVHGAGEALLQRPDGAWLVSADTGTPLPPSSVSRHLAGGARDPFYTNAPPIAFVRNMLSAANGKVWVISADHPGATRLQNDDYVPPAPPVIVRPPRSIAASGLQVASFRVVADGVRPLTYQWRFNGAPIPGATADVWNVAPITPASLGVYDVVVTGGGQSTVSDPATLGNDFPPSILTQPLFRTNVLVGTTVTLSVEATGTAPLSYQWRRNGIDLPGANAATLVLTDLQLTQEGGYSVRITNTAGSVISTVADVKVTEPPRPPSIIHEPADRTVIAVVGSTCFEVGVAGSSPLRFQWQKNGVDVPGATTVSLCLNSITDADAGRYRLIVINDQGRAESREAVLSVVPPVFAIIEHPTSLNLLPNQPVSFSVETRNDLVRPLTYQWRRNGVVIPGATNRVLRLDPPTISDVGVRLDVVVSDGIQTLTSNAAVPTGTPQANLCPGPVASIFRYRENPLPIVLGVDALGFGTLTYQWRRGPAQVGQVEPLSSFVPIPGATSSTLTLASPTATDVGDYLCEVRNEFGTSLVDIVAQAGAMRVRLVENDTRPGRVDFGWDYLALGEMFALNGVEFLSDGRVYVTGSFGNPLVGCSPLTVLARLNANGTLDPTFAPVTAAMGTSVGLVHQPSGKIVIAGNFRGISGQTDPGPSAAPGFARYDANGTPDPTFQTSELGLDGSGGNQIAGQTDGRILIVRQSVVYRLLPDGAKDTTFGGAINSSHSPGIDTSAEVRRMIVDAKDRIYLLTAHGVFRYQPNGQPDPAWSLVTVGENLIRMAVGLDGSVFATGYRASTDTSGSELRIMRFLANGERDADYHPDYPVGGTIAGAPGVQPDNRLVIAGTAGTLSARLNSNGTPDASWDTMASPGGVSAPAYEPYWFFGTDGRALLAGFAFDDGIGFSVPGGRWLFRLHNGGTAFGQVRLETPRFVNGRIQFQIPTERGRIYTVQFLGSLSDAAGPTVGWSTQQTLTGDGSSQTVDLGTSGSVGFYRILATP